MGGIHAFEASCHRTHLFRHVLLSPLRFRLFIVAEACDLAYFCKQRVLAGLEEASYIFSIGCLECRLTPMLRMSSRTMGAISTTLCDFTVPLASNNP